MEIDHLKAVDNIKRDHIKQFPSWVLYNFYKEKL